LELSLGEQKLAAVVNQAHDPPLVGAKEDRSKRTESYVKDFRPLDMGEIQLEAGAGKLVLRATEIPGEQSIDFRLLFLTRVE
ncbi:MAG: N-acetylgalactosamine 6-sulfate sulfatase, partial [Planctomycetota bacterium]